MALTQDIRIAIGEDWGSFQTIFEDCLKSRSSLLDKINSYLLDASGKQLRPLLALVTAKACSGSINVQALACAAVAEMIHTATLLHDDVVDDSGSRRGRPTVMKLFSPGASLLVGDFWLSRAIKLLVRHDCPYETLATFAKALEDLAEGELIQMDLAENLNSSREDYYAVISRKTASLFIASVKSAAIVSGADAGQIEALEAYAYHLGCAFQIRDDILDYHPSSETGKDSDSDLLERKATLPLLCAIEGDTASQGRVRALMSRIDPSKGSCPENLEIVAGLKDFVRSARGIEAATAVLREETVKAVRSLDCLPESSWKAHLCSIADYIAEN